jgi:hypothetical protein
MKFNPSTKQLLTNEGVLIKNLHCPRGVKWSDLGQTDSFQRHCEFCEKNIVDIQNLDDETVLAIAIRDTGACLKLDINDSNIRVINHKVFYE